MSFMICDNKGFHIEFPNGVVLSTQFGGGNYGTNYHERIERYEHGLEADTVEVAAFNAYGGEWRTREAVKAMGKPEPSDDVLGYLGIGDWLKFFDAVRALPKSGRPK